jgi:hypothetical protein
MMSNDHHELDEREARFWSPRRDARDVDIHGTLPWDDGRSV